MATTTVSRAPPYLDFFRKPVVGIVGSIASVGGIGLALYLYVASRESPELTYFVHPAKAAVVRTDQTSRLSVQFDGHELTNNITAAQIAFWNAGKKAIRSNSILSPLVIKIGTENRILEAKIRKTSRDVVNISLDTSRFADGEVEIRWNILEQNDGGVLQIVFVGDEAVDIQARAVLEGQSEIVKLELAREIRSRGEQYVFMRGFQSQLVLYMNLVIGVLILVYSIFLFVTGRETIEKTKRRYLIMLSKWTVLTLGAFIFGSSVWFLMTRVPPVPPFGF